MAELGKLLDDEDIIFNEAVTQHAGGADANSAPPAQHDGRHRRRRARLVGRHGARRQARRARPAHGASGRRRQLLFRQSELGLCRLAAIQAADLSRRARQFRLVGGEAIDAAGVPGRRGQGRQCVRGGARRPRSSSPRSARRSAPTPRRSAIPPTCPRAIARCAKEVRGGRSALLHARVTPPIGVIVGRGRWRRRGRARAWR